MTATAKLFMNGRSQAVRLPAEFRMKGNEVFIERIGDALVLREKPKGWDDFFAKPSKTPEDFLADRGQEPPQDRDCFHDMDA
ncbi:AbrB/MazE/SpoVT family DNA-binding domain-containing protein [Thiorhodovibrio frisius]|uniref:Virulence-associated protein n=1 Tax=Thiorhodovibrio frisius TaxID=631362 RepID=H8Z4S0_9GAMM|nr:AbrB/MazE/SpoVT family DNA-binding domain-containing protein [Thiorhodovibrio frisius]EIC20327.1 virulence-associated protein [Thiorhodovibrio frisius]WPL21065.1 Antitoxin VapB1 [Thiorhodovibrio frisius]